MWEMLSERVEHCMPIGGYNIGGYNIGGYNIGGYNIGGHSIDQ